MEPSRDADETKITTLASREHDKGCNGQVCLCVSVCMVCVCIKQCVFSVYRQTVNQLPKQTNYRQKKPNKRARNGFENHV